MRKYSKILYMDRKSAGLCTYCGRRPALSDQAQCSVCSTRRNLNAKKRRTAKKRAGICRECNAPSLPLHGVCLRHLLKRREQDRKRYAKCSSKKIRQVRDRQLHNIEQGRCARCGVVLLAEERILGVLCFSCADTSHHGVLPGTYKGHSMELLERMKHETDNQRST